MMKVRKGFTLVELLIVIVIIGILAAAMMLASGSATASAEASNIVTDLRNMKAAALMLYADSMDDMGSITPAINLLATYMDNKAKVDANSGYVFVEGTAVSSEWYVGYTNVAPEVGKKLIGRVKSLGLFSGAANTAAYAGGTAVYMIAR